MTNEKILNETNRNNFQNKSGPKIANFGKGNKLNFNPIGQGDSPSVFFNTCFDKNHLKTVIAWFLEQYGEKVTIDLVEILKQVGFHQATLAGVSLGVDDLQIPPQKALALSEASVKMGEVKNAIQAGTLTSVEKSQRLIDTWNQTSDNLRQNAVQNFRTTNPVNPVYMMAFSGARGNISQVRQLVAMRGLMADPQGAILEFPIQSNFREGLTITEYLISCYGARKGLVDTALRTATSGYLTRRLVDAVQHVVVHVTDCGTKKGIIIKNKNLEQRLVGRVLVEDIEVDSTTVIAKNTLISQSLAKLISASKREILVRSPLTCNTEKSVCQFCYGLDLAQGKLVSLGEAVGILAAQSIGEPGTQLTMRTFHTGGVGVFSDQAMKSFVAPFDGKIEFLNTLPGLFVRTPHGNIVYLLKHTLVTNKKEFSSPATRPLLRLHPFSSSSQVFEIHHADVPSGSLLWVKQGDSVKAGDLLLQASRLENAAQEMPESSHPVASPFSGEVYFQSMKIRTIEEEKTPSQKAKKKKQEESTPTKTNDKEISPTFRTLVDLGNFWVFSSFVQKESSFSNSFFQKGDCISTETPISQYNLHVPIKGQLKNVKSNLSVGQNYMEFLISKISYSQVFYVLQEFRQKENYAGRSQNKSICEKSVIVYSNNSKQARLNWYPLLKNLPIQLGGYCSVVQNFGHQGSFLWTHQQIKYFPNFKPLLKSSCFLVNQTSHHFSKKGIFHINFSVRIQWSTKINFPGQSFKNSSQLQNLGSSSFIKQSLNAAHYSIFNNVKNFGIQQKTGWFYVPKTTVIRNVSSQLPSILLEPGQTFEKISFSNSTVSFQFLKNQDLVFLKSNLKNKKIFSYSLDDLINSQSFVQQNFPSSVKKFLNESQILSFPKSYSDFFSFYKKKIKNQTFRFQLKQKRRVPYVIFIQKNSYHILPDIKFFKQSWFLQKKAPSSFSIQSPLITKQFRTVFDSFKNPKPQFILSIPLTSTYFSVSNFLKVEVKFDFPKGGSKLEQLKHPMSLRKMTEKFGESFGLGMSTKVFVPGLSFLFSRNLKLQNWSNYTFQTFENNWILPQFKITESFRKSEKLGQFQRVQKKQKQRFFSILRNQDLVTIKLPLKQLQKIGSVVRWGDEICPGCALQQSGQILKIAPNTLTIRKGIPLLASTRGLVHVFHNDIVEKNDLVMTLKSRRLQTEDIVQGIPKIEQLFEARETQGGEFIENNMHILLQEFFNEVSQVKPFQEAIDLSLAYIQKFLVENILAAYSNQGVHIAEKHVEVVVRQMTARVRITSGGDTGFLPGEFIQHRWIERVNQRLAQEGRREARYEPIILGITKSVLQSESFLVAASFQQVSKVLIKSALSKKTDFLRGLHENILVGQPIPAGTGLISRLKLEKSSDSYL